MQICRDVAQGLRFLHSSKPPIMHGDLKGKNILIDSRFRAKLCDFGLSTKKNSVISGTPYWLAPEYLRGQTPYTPACDIYSMGIVLYEIYSRKDPYAGEDFRETLRKVCDRRTNKRPQIPPTCPPKMADLMKKCWAPDPMYRYQAKDLDSLLLDLNMRDAEPLTTDDQVALAAEKRRKKGDMLYDLFPKHIADALKAGQKVEPEQHEEVTVVFSEIINFAEILSSTSPMQVSNLLDRLYMAFDKVATKHNVFKVETVGDAYMGVTNLEKHQEDTHVRQAARFAIDLVIEGNKILIDDENPQKGYINIRAGFHSGPVVSNVIGSLNPRYGLFGDTVNTASRMETNSKANRVLCSEAAYKLLRDQAPELSVRKRRKIAVKGKGDMTVYWIGDKEIYEGKRFGSISSGGGSEDGGGGGLATRGPPSQLPSNPPINANGSSNPHQVQFTEFEEESNENSSEADVSLENFQAELQKLEQDNDIVFEYSEEVRQEYSTSNEHNTQNNRQNPSMIPPAADTVVNEQLWHRDLTRPSHITPQPSHQPQPQPQPLLY